MIKKLTLSLIVMIGLMLMMIGSVSATDKISAITSTADRLVTLQSSSDTGWDWEVTGLIEHSGNPSAYNMYGVVILGLLDAYEETGTQSYLDAATAMANHMTSGNASLGEFYKRVGEQESAGAYDYQFLMRYAEVSGNSDYSDYAIALWNWNKANTAIFASPEALNDALLGWAGSDPGAASWMLAAFGTAIHAMGDDTFATGCADLIVADLAENGEGWLVGDHMALAESLEFLSELDSVTYSSTIDSIITDLIDAQQAGGYWDDGFAGTFQDTVYPVRALAVYGGIDGLNTARKGAAWLIVNQLGNGGWLEDDDKEYSEQDAEALRALIATAAPVTNDGKSYYTIQSAIDYASLGDTIEVAAGTYDEQVIIDKSLTLQGAGDTTIIQPSGAEVLTTVKTTPWLNGGTKPMAAIVFVDAADEVTVRDLKIDGSLITTLPSGISVDHWVAGLAYLETSGTIESVSVQGYPQLGTRSCGIWTSATSLVSDVEVKQSDVIGYNRGSIYACGETLTVDFNHNEIYGPGEIVAQVPNGMFFLEGATGSATYNTITDLAYTGETYRSTGIGTFRPGPNLVFGYNEIYNVQNAFAIAGGSGATIEYNYVHDCHTGVKLEAITYWEPYDRARNVMIQYNDIMNNDFAIRAGGDMGDGNVAHYNNFVGNLGTEWFWDPDTWIGAVSNVHQTYILDAINNWWGCNEGPGELGCDTVSANVAYDPWTTQGQDTVTTTPGVPEVVNTSGTDTEMTITTNATQTDATVTVQQYTENPEADTGLITITGLDVYLEITTDIPDEEITEIVIKIYYDPANLEAEGISELSLKPYWWNPSTEEWEVITGYGVNRDENYVYFTVTHLSLFTLGGSEGNVGGEGGDFISLTVPDFIDYGDLYSTPGRETAVQAINLTNAGSLSIVVTPIWESGAEIFKRIKFSDDDVTYSMITGGVGPESDYSTTTIDAVVVSNDPLIFANTVPVWTKIKIALDDSLAKLVGPQLGTIYFSAGEA